MAYITGEVAQQDGSLYTKHQSRVDSQSKTYVYKAVQDTLTITNAGDDDLSVTVNGVTSTIKAANRSTFTAVSQFIASAPRGRQPFLVESWVDGGVTESPQNIADTSRIREMWRDPAGRLLLMAIMECERKGETFEVYGLLDSLAATKTWLDTFRRRLQAALGDGGLGWVALNNTITTQEGMSFGVGAGSQRTNVQFDPVGEPDCIYNPNLYNLTFTAAVNSIMSLDDKLHEFDSATAFYVKKPDGGTFNFRDQLAPTSGNIVVDTVAGSKSLGWTTRTGWPANTKSNKLQAVVNGNVHLIGMSLKRGTGGCRVHRLAQPGTKLDQVRQLDGTSFTAFLGQNGKPGLVVFLAGMNDAPTGTAADYETNTRTVLSWFRAANPNTAILLLLVNEPNDSSKNDVLETFRRKLVDVIAPEFKAMVWDERTVLGSYAQALAAGMMDDGTHPNDAVGNPARGNAIFNFIGGNALGDIRKALLN